MRGFVVRKFFAAFLKKSSACLLLNLATRSPGDLFGAARIDCGEEVMRVQRQW